jgi:hypothetical protein
MSIIIEYRPCMLHPHLRRASWAALLTSATLACSDEDTVRLNSLETPAPDAMPTDSSVTTPPDDAPAESVPPLYAIGASVFGPEGNNTSYVALVPSLGREVQIDYSQVLEVASASTVFGPHKGAVFAVGLDEKPTLTKYEITEQARFVEHETLDFTNFGLSYMWRDPGLVPFLSANKAYVLDADELQVVVWDPEAMLIVGSFSIDGVADADYPITRFEPDPTLRGDELLVVATHSTDDVTAPFSTLISFDTKNDRVTRVLREERCGGLWDSVQDSKGDVYFSTGVWDAAQHRVLGDSVAAAPCIVRVKAGANEFDPNYFVEATSIGGTAAGGLVSGGGDVAYLKVLDEAALPAIEPTDFDDVWAGANWSWWRVELGSNNAQRSSLPAAGGGGGELYVDGKAYARNTDSEFSATTLLDMSASGGPSQQLSLRGYPYGIVRVR